ncbi:hypothetical protein FO507_00715 [Bacillus mojavensis]|uniref:DUF3953 domain-containing protein n=1 Tax=Bacillus mojavensis TaxID=72360 RepID=A0AAP3CVA5_BACMO|nr:membrane protein [Bacillus mojavensis]MCY8511701.1 hypothetical protein [Bacillus mojavensis]MDR4225918.1 hypothetical protein [Bacillus mojavensis]MEC1668410.1 hypothetical protein [Bacillus mojavensis]MEC3588598.1 hypothetical protein [Bacillus mojavensis]MEC5245369.1 hypothetical protein [Bacillus mojavensis]
MLKASKILISCVALILCVYSLYHQSAFLLFSLQVLVALLFVLMGVETLSKKQIRSAYLLFGSAAFILVVNVVKYMI